MSSYILVSTVCPLRVWKTTFFEVRALVAGSKDDEKKLIGPRLVRRLGGIPSALARRELHMPDLANKLMLVFLEKKGNKKDALDRRHLANRRYEAIARRPGQTLQDFFATENKAYADAVKAGVGIDPDRRAYHMFIKSGLIDDQINYINGFVYESEAEGPGAALDPRKIQEAVLRFYDKPWDVDRHRDSRASMGRYSRPLMGMRQRRTVVRRRIIPGPGLATRAATRKSPGKKKLSRLKMATSTTTGTSPGNNTQPKSTMTGNRKLVWKPSWLESLTGSIGMCWTPMFLIHT